MILFNTNLKSISRPSVDDDIDDFVRIEKAKCVSERYLNEYVHFQKNIDNSSENGHGDKGQIT